MGHYRQAVQLLTEMALQTDKGIVLASTLIEHLRQQSVILPALNAVERASAEAITRANRRIYDALAEPLSDAHRRRLDDLLKRRDNGKTTWLAAAPIARQTEFAAHAGTHRTPQSVAGARPAFWHRAVGAPEPPAQDRP